MSETIAETEQAGQKVSPLFNEDDKVKVMTWAEWMESHGYETNAYNKMSTKIIFG